LYCGTVPCAMVPQVPVSPGFSVHDVVPVAPRKNPLAAVRVTLVALPTGLP
jgi:hypothetical protein